MFNFISGVKKRGVFLDQQYFNVERLKKLIALDSKYNLDTYEAIGYAVEYYRHQKQYAKCLSEYSNLANGVEFPTKYRFRYPLWHHESHILAGASGEQIVGLVEKIIKIMKNSIGVENNL